MGRGKPATKRDNGHRARDRKILVGDIVVTAVAGQYAIGQVTRESPAIGRQR